MKRLRKNMILASVVFFTVVFAIPSISPLKGATIATTAAVDEYTATLSHGDYFYIYFIRELNFGEQVSWAFEGSNSEVGISLLAMTETDFDEFIYDGWYFPEILSDGSSNRDFGMFEIPSEFPTMWYFVFSRQSGSPNTQSTTLTIELELISFTPPIPTEGCFLPRVSPYSWLASLEYVTYDSNENGLDDGVMAVVDPDLLAEITDTVIVKATLWNENGGIINSVLNRYNVTGDADDEFCCDLGTVETEGYYFIHAVIYYLNECADDYRSTDLFYLYAVNSTLPATLLPTIPTPTQHYVEHEPIHITDNSDFVAYGFPGAGTKENPYIIAGLNITNKAHPLIYIKQTTLHFQIQNNFLNGLTSGVRPTRKPPSYDFIDVGIMLEKVTHGTIDNNIVINCGRNGIYLGDSHGNIIANNTFSYNQAGIRLDESTSNTLIHNTIVNNSWTGIYLDNYLVTFGNNTIANNNVSHNEYGIELSWSEQNLLSGNTISNNAIGIYIAGLRGGQNTLAHNIITNNSQYGICLNSEYNIIQENNFLGNNAGETQACDHGSNNVFAYNYWDDHDNTDRDGDEIADTPYNLAGNQDLTPRVTFTNPHHLSLPIIIYPRRDETLQGTVTLHWTPTNDTWGHSVSYAVSYSADDGQTWIPLAAGLTHPSYEWETTTVADGPSYRIKVEATCVEGLTAEDSSDTSFTIQNQASIATTVDAFSHPGGPVVILFATLILIIFPILRIKRKFGD